MYKKHVLYKILLGVFLAVLVFPTTAVADSTSGLYYGSLKKELRDYLNRNAGTYGVYVMDISTGSSFGVNECEVFHAASTVKLPIGLYLLNLVKEGRVSFDDRLVYMEEHFESGTGVLQNDPFGTSYRVNRLLKESIVVSDNVATNMLLGYVGRANVKGFMRNLGGTVVDDFSNTTCPLDMANYMFEVLLFTAKEPVLGGMLMDHLYNTEFNERLPASLPEGTLIAHKIGTWPPTGTYNDVGFVEHPSRPYIISVLSENVPTAAEAFRVIRYISRLIYDYHSGPDFSVEIFFNGRKLPLGESAILRHQDKKVLVPLREITKAIPGLGVYWNGVSRKIVVTSYFTRQHVAYPVDDENIQIVEGKSYIPIHVFADDLNYKVTWDAGMRRFFLSDSVRYPNLLITRIKNWGHI
ncbi:MAG TPA: serine hydrolase [Clostridia bacterium]|nr:serine hydrolase [Clostridia bacterium]